MSPNQPAELTWDDVPNQRIGAVWCWTFLFLLGACAMDLAHLPRLLMACVSAVALILVLLLWVFSAIAALVIQVTLSTDLPAIYCGVMYCFWIFRTARKVGITLMLDHNWSIADCRRYMRGKLMHALTAFMVTSTVLTFVRTVLELYVGAIYGLAAGWFYVAGVSLGGASFFLPYLKAAHSIKIVAKTKAMV